ncbi:DEAD/DEAH box helicase [Yoonia sp.]|uniref:DEAD/DEAH box helicase n=1 Tax=Yoonia sp. TaxID=2212373 RepID=UPI002DF8D6DE|nr:DEAD/DEAH box helicase [Yoonia sp.]
MLNFTPPKDISLRDYQASAIDGLRDAIRGGKKRLILCAGTGAGKTLTAAHLLREASRKGSYALFIVDRVALVDQTSAVFDEYGIPHGIVQGINDRWMPYENVQVCSAQTLAKRSLPRAPSLIVVDECHAQYKATLQYMEKHPDAVKIGLTATPFTKGMGDHWDDVVNVIPTRRLIEGGHLIEPKIYVAKSPEDAELGLNSYGEFSDASAATAGIQIIGDVVSEWVGKTNEHFGGPAKTIVFSPTVEHGRELCAAFRAAGYNFQQISYLDRDDSERAEKIAEFRKPNSQIMGLVSCGVLTKGFDVPDVKVGISCKPYRKSLSSHMQEIGRIMRTHPDKSLALWLCHSGNVERFAMETYDVWENGAGELDKATKRDSQPRERNEVQREKVVCPSCSGAMRGPTCTVCGFEKPARSGVHVVEGELQQFSMHDAMQPRSGLRADCLKEPRKVYEGALSYAVDHTRKGEDAARKWAAGIWRGVYPTAKLPFGWYDMPIPRAADVAAYSLAEREVKRFRKQSKRGAA